MRREMVRCKVMVILLLFLCSIGSNVAARSVHSTSDVDIYPQGEISSDDSWYLDNRITFTQENADYTVSMVEDNRITLNIQDQLISKLSRCGRNRRPQSPNTLLVLQI